MQQFRRSELEPSRQMDREVMLASRAIQVVIFGYLLPQVYDTASIRDRAISTPRSVGSDTPPNVEHFDRGLFRGCWRKGIPRRHFQRVPAAPRAVCFRGQTGPKAKIIRFAARRNTAFGVSGALKLNRKIGKVIISVHENNAFPAIRSLPRRFQEAWLWRSR